MVSYRSAAKPAGPALLPPAFRCLPLASSCQVQQLFAPSKDSWGLSGAPQGAPLGGPRADETAELLSDYFSVPRLLSVGDVIAVPLKAFRYAAPICGGPCNGALPGAPLGPAGGHQGGLPAGCTCCVSLHELEHAEDFGVGGPRCELLGATVLCGEEAHIAWGPLFTEGPSVACDRQQGSPGSVQGGGGPPDPGGGPQRAPGSSRSAAGGGLEGLTLLRRQGAPPCCGGAPCCHWGAEDAVYGCGHREELHEIAAVFRITALEGPWGPPAGAPNGGTRGGALGPTGHSASALVFKGGTDLMLQEAPGWGPLPPLWVRRLSLNPKP